MLHFPKSTYNSCLVIFKKTFEAYKFNCLLPYTLLEQNLYGEKHASIVIFFCEILRYLWAKLTHSSKFTSRNINSVLGMAYLFRRPPRIAEIILMQKSIHRHLLFRLSARWHGRHSKITNSWSFQVHFLVKYSSNSIHRYATLFFSDSPRRILSVDRTEFKFTEKIDDQLQILRPAHDHIRRMRKRASLPETVIWTYSQWPTWILRRSKLTETTYPGFNFILVCFALIWRFDFSPAWSSENRWNVIDNCFKMATKIGQTLVIQPEGDAGESNFC